jgi:hypothetical protein
MPAGIEIIIAIEKLKAIITKKVLTFLLETFLTALVKTPNLLHLSNAVRFEQKNVSY